MKRVPTILVLLTIIVLPFFFSSYNVSTEDCFVQIISVTMNQSSLEIGERLQVNLVYDLYYDQTDPLGIGSVSVSFSVQGISLPIISYEFTSIGFDIQEVISFDIIANDWSPNQTGQIGVVLVEGWVHDSIGSMTDSVQQQFTVEQSDLLLQVNPPPSQITFHENFNLTGRIVNPHNSTVIVSYHPLLITATENNHTLQSWNSETDLTNNFTHLINSTLLRTGNISCNIVAFETEDYRTTNTSVSFSIINASLILSVILNTTEIQSYYPSMNNYSILVSAYLQCQAANHAIEEANVTCYLANNSKAMIYNEPNKFVTELTAPSSPGNYSVLITATAPNHDSINTSVPLLITHRIAQLSLITNCTEAALGDTIGFTLGAIDLSSQVPIADKICSVYLFNHSEWNLLTQVILNQNGLAHFSWKAQNVGNQDFRFKMFFHGSPEFRNEETEVTVTNTHDIRFICKSTLSTIRPANVSYVVQLTTLEFQPLYNVSIHLIEISSNSTWCISLTNISGYATLSWQINENYTLGSHDFYLLAQGEVETLGIIRITMTVYEQTVLEQI